MIFNNKSRGFFLLTGLGFVVAIGIVGLFIFTQFSRLFEHYRAFTMQIHNENIYSIEQLCKVTLTNMTDYIEKQYPFLYDKEQLRQDAGTDWYWDIADEWQNITETFNFEYIYFIEKEDDNFIYLLSSGIRRDYKTEQLLSKVWEGIPPAIFFQAWETKRLTISPIPYSDEYGTFISAAYPITNAGGEVIGIIGVDYDVSYLEIQWKYELDLIESESNQLARIRSIFCISIIVILILLVYQAWLSNSTIVKSARNDEIDKRTRLMLDNTPMNCTLWDTDGNLIECNLNILKIYGVPDKAYFIEHFFDLLPPYQPNGDTTRDFIMQLIKKTVDNGYSGSGLISRTYAGEYLPLDVSAVRIPWKDDYRIAFYSQDLRENKAKEMALKESEDRLHAMVDNMALGCLFFDLDANLMDCNERAIELFGFQSKNEFLSQFFLLSPEYQPNGSQSTLTVKEIVHRIFKTGHKEIILWEHIRSDGTLLPVEVTALRVSWKDGYRAVGYLRDLREERTKEAALQETEDRLQAMVDNMAFACFFFDIDTNLLDCNQRAVKLFGADSKQEIIDNFFNFSPEYQPDGKPSRIKAKEYIYDAYNNENTRLTTRWEHIKPDGTRLPVEVYLERIKWKNSYRIVSYVRDLSKLVETEDNLKRVLASAESSPNFNMFLGSGGRIEYQNPAVNDISGYSREELQKDGLALIFSPEDFDLFINSYMAAAFNDETVNFEMTVISKNGDKFDFVFSVFPVKLYYESTNAGLLGRDITEIKKMQLDLADAKEQAERALASEVSYNKAKSDFLSRVSHELRTPLNAITGMTGIVKNSSNKSERYRGCTVIEESTEQLLDLVNDILDLTGLDTGNFSFTSQPFSFNKAIMAVIDNIGPKALAKKQVFLTDIDSRIHDWLDSDERRLRQILIKLLSNAVKFTPEKGKINFSAQLLESDNNECKVHFEIRDNGPGMSAEVMERLWDVLEQADNSITREYGGMGLSLALIKRIVEMMQGKLQVESEPGKGAKFTFYLRFAVAQAEEAKEDGTILGESVDLGGKHILVVDDVEINRAILIAMLEDTGAILDEASTGDEAVRIFKQGKYDLVLMDLHMPVMDGFLASKNIRALDLPWAKTIPIISISAESGGDLHRKCLESGITDHILKPVDMPVLFSTINKWMLVS